jgi:hypothetical protein
MEGGIKMSVIHAPGNVSSRGHRGRRKINNVMVSGKIYMDHPQQANYENLANAIIETAVDDYRKALRRIKIHYSSALNLVSSFRMARLNDVIICLDVEDFFRSEWYYTLTDIDGDYLIKKLREEIMDYKTIQILDQSRAEREKKYVNKRKTK